MRTNIAQWPRARSVGAATASLAHDRPGRKQVRLAEQRACRNTGNKSEDLRGRTDTYLQTPRRRHLSTSVFIASHCEWVTYGKRALSAASAHAVKRCKKATRSGILATRNVVDTRTFSGGKVLRLCKVADAPRINSRQHRYSETARTNGSLHFSSVRIVRSVSVLRNATRATLGTSGSPIPLAEKFSSRPSRFGCGLMLQL